MTKLRQVEIAKNDLGYDAWGRPKVINDYSLFSGLWTFNVLDRIWLQYNNTGVGYIEQPLIDKDLIKSIHGHLKVTGDSNTDVHMASKRHLRYQPNKGLLYSTATIIPDPNFIGTRQFGLMTNEHYGLFFELIGDGASWVMNVVKRSTKTGVLSEQRVNITDLLPDGFDPSKGHVYDLQMEWRGVGNFYVYVDLELIYTFELLGTLTDLSIENPALSVGFTCKGAAAGSPISINAGCVDVTSEGGYRANKVYTSISTGKTLAAVKSTGTATIAVKIPQTVLYDGVQVPYTRDALLTEILAFCKDEAFFSGYSGRAINLPNLDGLAGWVDAPDSFYQFATNTGGLLNTAYQADKAALNEIFVTRNEKDFATSIKNPSPDDTTTYLLAGDIFVFEIQSDNNSTAGVTVSFAEEV